MNSSSNHAHPLQPVFLISLFVLTAILYWPGLTGGFLFDDGNSISENSSIKIDSLNSENLLDAAFSRETGILKRPVSMISFAVNHALTGLNPYYFKLTNLIIHLLCGALLYVFLRQAVRQWATLPDKTGALFQQRPYLFPTLIAAFWLLHPLNLTAVLYIVQRMASLAALFTLLGFVVYGMGRERMLAGKSFGQILLLIALIVPGSLAIFSKENGALLIPFLFLIECCVFRFKTIRRSDKRFLIGFYFMIVLVPSLLVLLILLVEPSRIISSFSSRDFTLNERLLTETRVLFFHLQQLIFPLPSSMSLFHDGFPVSQGVLQPTSTLFAIIGHVVLLLTGLASLKKKPVIAFAILWFYVAHSMESTIFPLELVFEHRNYLAIIGPLILLMLGMFFILSSTRLQIFASLLIIAMLSLTLLLRTVQWSNTANHMLTEAQNHPNSSRANDYAGMVYESRWRKSGDQMYHEKAVYHYQRATDLNRHKLEPMLGLLTLQDESQRKDTQVELIRRLKNSLFHPSWLNAFENLVNRQPEGIDIELFVFSLMENPRVSSSHRANLFNLLAIHADKNNDQEKAGSYIRQARDTDPENILFHLGYAHWLFTQNKLDEALHVLEKASTRPMNITMKNRLNKKRNFIQRKQKHD